MADPYVIASWVCCVTAVVGFALYSVIFTYYERRKALSDGDGDGKKMTTEDFVTARGTANISQVAWSFYASSVGAWVIVTPASFAAFAGWVGMVMYALACGIPVLAIAYFGIRLQKIFPNCSSLSDFCGTRYGWGTQGLTVVLTLFNMAIVIIAEFTTIGSLFSDFVGTIAWPFIALVAVLTLSYTAYGGLHISIITDRVQAIFTVLLISILCIYLAVTFRYDLGPLPPSLGPNFFGYSAILTLPLSLMGASIFSEALWQRVWASQDHRTLQIGAGCGCVIIIMVVFLSGFFGFLAAWAGLIDDSTNPNLYMFQIFKSEPEGGNANIDNWVGVLIMILAVTMNESAIDSFQNGFAASLSCRFFLTADILWIRLLVCIINIPLVFIALFGLDVLSLFLITNMLTTACMVPVMMGMYSGPGDAYMSDWMSPVCFLLSFIGTTAYGTYRAGGNVAQGLYLAWYGNQYAADYFGVAIGTSIGAMLLWLGVRWFFDKVVGVWQPVPVDWAKLKVATHEEKPKAGAAEEGKGIDSTIDSKVVDDEKTLV